MTPFRVLAGLTLVLAIVPLTARSQLVLEARTSAAVPLSYAGGTDTMILQVQLPTIGQYRAVAKVAVTNTSGTENYVRCGLTLDGVARDSSVTVIGGSNAPPSATLVTEALITTTTANRTVNVLCSHDHASVAIVAAPNASLVLNVSPAGDNGDRGQAGPQGPSGPAGITTFGVCVGVNASNPSSSFCSCQGGKLLSRAQTAGQCSVVTQSGSCTTNGYAPQGAVGMVGVFEAACCACSS